MIRSLFVILILLFQIIATDANPKQVNSHGHNFSLVRNIVVVAKGNEAKYAGEIALFLQNEGVAVKVVKTAWFAKAKIVVKKVTNIEGAKGMDAFQITVTPNLVTVMYTSEEAARRSFEYLRRATVKTMIKGFDILDWNDEKVMSDKSTDIFDASSAKLPLSQIENFARNSRSKEVFVRFVDNKQWRLESSVFQVVNPRESIYPANGGYYSMNEIADLINRLAKSKITLIPVVDLLSENEPFVRVTGHHPSSVEGMRFVRAVMEEYSQKLGGKKLCLGGIPSNRDKRYLEFLNDMARRFGIELVLK